FPRYLGHYVRELCVLTLEEAVRHLAGTPAARLGLDRGDAPRGIIREGAIADLVLFDPQTVAAGATFERPLEAPIGILEVLIGGVPVLS
ncbi:amidohydrolase family protein, partial [Bacillus sp. SIMBA_005]|uniref:amidohydrolase family protein n=1 Tax=Bacillus sp. SIMBA_005 TaxID=3085754 RepID=UPI00397DF7D2